MKFLNSKIFTVLISILTLWFVISSINLNLQRSIVDRQVKGVEAKIKEVQDDTSFLNKFLAYFKSSAFLEKEARLKLNYKAQREEVAFIYRDKNVESKPDGISLGELLAKMPNYKKWALYLLGY